MRPVLKQAANFIAGGGVMLLLSRLPPNRLRNWTPVIFGVTLVLLPLVFVVGSGRSARLWINIGFYYLPPGELLSLTAYVARQSRGVPIDITIDARTQPFLDAGRATFDRRQGQLNLACAQCHDANWGRRLAGNVIPQAHPTGYPIYRLEWQSLGSLQRRLRNCLVGMRAEPYEYGAPEFVDLELYLMWRARGMTMETPAVRP